MNDLFLPPFCISRPDTSFCESGAKNVSDIKICHHSNACEEALTDLFLPSFCISRLDTSFCESGAKHVSDIKICHHSNACDICQNSKKYLSPAHLKFLLNAHHRVLDSGKFNFQECRIPVYSKLNVDYICSWLTDFKDQALCELLEFGFPVGFNGDQSLFEHTESSQFWKFRNHKGARDFPKEIDSYLLKESMYKAIGGPFKNNPFKHGIKISPLNSVPKKDPSERRIILDFKFS